MYSSFPLRAGCVNSWIAARVQSPGGGERAADQPAVHLAGAEVEGDVPAQRHVHLHHFLGAHGQLLAEIQYVLCGCQNCHLTRVLVLNDRIYSLMF